MKPAETGHSPEPWHARPYTPLRWDIGSGAEQDPTAITLAAGMAPADARRVVACVNACRSIPTSALEAGKLGEALALLVEALADRGHADEPECLACRANEIVRALRVMP